MKKTISTIFGLAALSLATLTTSCSSDDNKNDGPKSDFVVVRDNLQGEINSGEVVLESGTYKLTGKLVVKNTAKLTIKPGVIIEATAVAADQLAAVRYIAVAQGGQIDVQGTASSPVIMTSETKKPAAWGGLVICGKAPINKGTTASAEVSDLTYGGTVANDNSGSIKYLRIEYPGFSYSSDKEFNGLSLFGVGSGTVIDYVQVYESSDDGFEWFGGTVSATHLVVSNKDANAVGDDLFDWTEGWNGNGEFWYGIRTNGGNRGIEADNNSNNHLATPISFPNIKGLTLIGGPSIGGESQGMKLRVGTKGKFDNVVLKGWATGFDVQHDETLSYVGVDLLATNVKFEDVTLKVKGTATSTGTVPDMTKLFTEKADATGAGNGSGVPTWTAGWTKGL
ncbi:hypothetical protein [Flavobacterium quisquiliarum]|uniref:Lipoprotein n=1 Tax=Flavobacterium quisquiliarum TaxID=1834436 RepID=A0ABV8W934_9FLAO|nr:hypothetical protein [Flavobacterium quisquiliarum]MBW1658104.1 hypothetical protein [Flavobacterium quisquiliarum]NWK99875.1 hypothetical protein [Flavobacterium collinsii]